MRLDKDGALVPDSALDVDVLAALLTPVMFRISNAAETRLAEFSNRNVSYSVGVRAKRESSTVEIHTVLEVDEVPIGAMRFDVRYVGCDPHKASDLAISGQGFDAWESLTQNPALLLATYEELGRNQREQSQARSEEFALAQSELPDRGF